MFYGTVGITILIFFIGGGIVGFIFIGNHRSSDIVSISIVMGFFVSSHLKNDKLGLKPEIGASEWISKTNNGK
jgi:predicted acetyltransferase